MGTHRTGWIYALGLGNRRHTEESEIHDRLSHHRVYLTCQIHEATAAFDPAQDGVVTHLPVPASDSGDRLGGINRIRQLTRHDPDRLGLDGHGNRIAVAVEDRPAVRGERLRLETLGQATRLEFFCLDDLHLEQAIAEAHPTDDEHKAEQPQAELSRGHTTSRRTGGHDSARTPAGRWVRDAHRADASVTSGNQSPASGVTEAAA